ncbi:hypothetical protein [Ruania alba]|uniref:Uncharacterized protein n=1 Tax=Ruania alba TaxID=648782 RepID=A0A1H5E624_9MICO|nr:hypothetical protein [Ruania alba]SED86554.1 hypothetical protein SAMN04488554_0905 [Ruania alba]
MSTTTDTTETGATNAVGAYARAVREHLNDLQPETLDELTGGLEADLTDSLADRLSPEELARMSPADMARRFGDPGAYAAEMRDAAGIAPPEPGRSGRRTLAQAIADGGRSLQGRWSAFVARHKILTAIGPMVRDLRPVWWVLRGWLLFQVASLLLGQAWEVFPDGNLFWLLLIGFVVLSVQWGRGAIGRGPGLRWTGYAASVFALLVALPVLTGIQRAASIHDSALRSATYEMGYDDGTAAAEQLASSGVVVDGERVDNLFVYGTDGQPIEAAQIVDQDGNPIILQPEGGDWESWAEDGAGTPISGVPLAALDDGSALNVFPYRTIAPARLIPEPDGSWSWDETDVRQPQWPLPSLTPLPDGDAPSAGSDAAPETTEDSTGEPERSEATDDQSAPEETGTG